MTKLILSPSKLDTFERCQLQFAYRYLENRIRPPQAAAAAIGSATHRAIEQDLAMKLQTGDLLPDDAVKDIARDSIENAWSLGVLDDADEPIGKGGAIDEAVSLAELHHAEVAPGIAPLFVERPFGVRVNDNVTLTGHIDVQELAGIRDSKTIKATPSAIKGEHHQQAQLYAAGVLANDGALPGGIKVDYLVKLKREKKALTLSAEVTDETVQRALDRLALTSRVIVRAVETGDFLPAPAGSWACSKKWCGYWDSCPFGKLGREGVRSANA